MSHKTVVLGVTGGIAAYKSAEIVSRLAKAGVSIRVIMTEHATKFISPLTFETLSNHPVCVDMFDRNAPWEVEHIALAKAADVFLIAPATANIIAKYAAGIADDMLSTTLLATKAPVLIAPAMNEGMWENPITQRNVAILKELGVSFIGPAAGRLACGDIGYGRMEEPGAIVDYTLDMLHPVKDLKGKRVVITAGPTRETIDPVRFLTNRSSGKMGFALAEMARRRGAEITVIHGPVAIDVPRFVRSIPVESTEQMKDAVLSVFPECDLLIKAAAPADFTPREVSAQKIKKQNADQFNLALTTTPDILSAVAQIKTHQVVVGFAAETTDVYKYAMDKLARKKLDMIVANDVSQEGAGFGVDTNIVTVFKKDGSAISYPQADKLTVADFVLDHAVTLM